MEAGLGMPRSKKSVNRFPLVEVTWLDASIRTDHEASADNPEEMEAFGCAIINQDVGYIARRDKSVLVLACSRTEEDNTYRCATTIPSGWVLHIDYMDYGKREYVKGREPKCDSTQKKAAKSAVHAGSSENGSQ
jgi:hypothetical protein